MISLSNQNSYVFYQLPNTEEIYFLKGSWTEIDIKKTNNLEGFIIANSDKTTTFFIEGKPQIISNKFEIRTLLNSQKNKELSKNEYLIKAQQFQVACKSNLKKIILSRIKTHPREKEENLFNTYLKLCHIYNHSFNYLLNIPENGTWMGASPETLVKEKNTNFTTVSLAGSKPTNSIQWEQKELEEQQLVTDYITKKLIQNTSQLKYNKDPETVLAGNVAHLKTTFNFKTEKTVLEIANLLHPTPAICGLPQKTAQDFIRKNEGYNRAFYTGYLGPINNKNSNLFVNLRCMQVFKNQFKLYIGGGITADSIPKKEWEETELKAETLLNIIR